MNFFYIKIFK